MATVTSSSETGQYTIEADVKGNGLGFAAVGYTNAVNAATRIIFSLSTGAITLSVADGTNWRIDSSSVTNQGGGWYRARLTVSKLTTTGSVAAEVFPSASGSSTSFAGDGTSGIYVTGVTVQRGPYLGYYPTSGAAYYGLRVADYSDSIGTANVRPGIKIESQATNLFLNSESPTTQSIAVTAQAYTLSCYGTGSIVLSGTGSGTLTASGSATQRTSLTFTPTAGTLTLTVSGTAKVQLETGAVPTSYIPTAGSTVTRSADLEAFSAVNQQGAQGTFYLDVDPAGLSSAQTILRNRQTPATGDLRVYLSNATTLIVEKVGTGTLTTHTVTAQAPLKIAVAFGASGVRSCVNGGTVLTSATTVNSTSGVTLGNDGAGGTVFNGAFYEVRHYASMFADATLQAITT